MMPRFWRGELGVNIIGRVGYVSARHSALLRSRRPRVARRTSACDAAPGAAFCCRRRKATRTRSSSPRKNGRSADRRSAVGFGDLRQTLENAACAATVRFSDANPERATSSKVRRAIRAIVLRGINTGGVGATVATYIDETPFGSATSLANGGVLAPDIDPFDLARVEVLRGPQGTLYGANSLGGLVKYRYRRAGPNARSAAAGQNSASKTSPTATLGRWATRRRQRAACPK